MTILDDDFWHGVGGNPATADEIEAAEKHIGHRLPVTLCELLLVRNGGVSSYSAYVSGDRYYPLLPVFGVDPVAGIGTVMRAYDVRESFGVPHGVVPFAGQGHAWWGLDYRSNPEVPSVVFRNSEADEIELVASSFDVLLEGLIEE